jgi:acyl transferase domain-containing protein
MGRELHGAFPVFAAAFDAVTAELDEHLDRPLAEVVWGDDAAVLEQTAYAQAALFAVEVALFRLLESWGLRPDFLAGHSIGELAAAHVAGVWSLPDACRVVGRRGRLMQGLAAGGAMAAVQATAQELGPLLAERSGRVDLAAVNGPDSAVVSGEAGAVDEVVAVVGGWGRRTSRLRVSHAFHSPLVEPVLAEFGEVLGQVRFSPPSIPIVSNATGELATDEELMSPEYWVGHVRGAVRFAESLAWLRDNGVARFVEAGPGGALSAMVQDCLDPAGHTVAGDRWWCRSCARGGRRRSRWSPRWPTCTRTAPRWTGRPSSPALGRSNCPPTPSGASGTGWIRRTPPTWPRPACAASSIRCWARPSRWRAAPGMVMTGRVCLRTHPWLADHAVGGAALFPGTAFLELALCAAARVGCEQVEELTLEAPLVLPEHGGVVLQVVVGGAGEHGSRAVAVYSQLDGAADDADGWVRHASGALAAGRAEHGFDTTTWPPTGAHPLDIDDLYDRFAGAGFSYGPAFRGLRAAWRSGDDVLAEVALPQPDAHRFLLHPALLDAALHAVALGGFPGMAQGMLPFSWTGVSLHAVDATSARVRLSSVGPDGVALALVDHAGLPIASIGSLVLRPAARAGPRESTDPLFRVDWRRAAPGAVASQAPAVLESGHPLELIAGRTGETYVDLESLGAMVDSGLPAPAVVAVACGGADVRGATHRALALVQSWLADERFDAARLAVLTRGAVATRAGEGVSDLGGAAVWGARAGGPRRRTRAGSCSWTSTSTRTRAPPSAVRWRPASRSWRCAAGRCTCRGWPRSPGRARARWTGRGARS